MEYNTSRKKLTMPEYGRNIQQMVDHTLTIEDPELRQKNVKAIIELMGILNPHLKNVEDFRHKLWDHLFLISDFKLEVESPYPIPTREKFTKKPEPLPYPKKYGKNRHLGKHIGQILDKALKETNEEKRNGFTQSIAYCMKLAYANWHKEAVHEDVIKEELTALSDGVLSYTGGGAKVRVENNRNQQQKKNVSGKKNNNKNRNNNNGNTGNNNNHYKKNKKNKNKGQFDN